MGNKLKSKSKKKVLVPRNRRIDSFTQADFSNMKMPCIAVYMHPADFPDKIIARVWESSINAPTNMYAEFETVEDAERDIEAAGFSTRIPRFPGDDITIVETYYR